MQLNKTSLTKLFFKNYSSNLKKLITFNSLNLRKLSQVIKYLEVIKNNNKKVIIFGNGGSAAIANHFSVDLTKVCNIRCVNFNESSFFTCLANDYGYENWVKKALEFHCDEQDMVILISSSGESKNMIKAAKFIKKKVPLITFTGFKKNNSLFKIGDINFWVNSKKYNYVENVHQILLLSLVDYIASKKL
jgi:D-sedoheptulose 7-phosphate isomerase